MPIETNKHFLVVNKRSTAWILWSGYDLNTKSREVQILFWRRLSPAESDSRLCYIRWLLGFCTGNIQCMWLRKKNKKVQGKGTSVACDPQWNNWIKHTRIARCSTGKQRKSCTIRPTKLSRLTLVLGFSLWNINYYWTVVWETTSKFPTIFYPSLFLFTDSCKMLILASHRTWGQFW